VRSALGASGGEILRLIMDLVSLLFGVSRLDPATYAGGVALLLVIAGAACWLPARRAARVDPAITLRSD
jgi:putative ABC transport system permease protein